jgi:hypothetical protein
MGRVTEYRGMQSTTNTKKEMERSRGPADIQSHDAADLKSELIKLAGRR